MNIADAFPLSRVLIYREAEKRTVDYYTVVLSTEAIVVVESRAAALRYPPPAAQDLLFVESTRPDAVYRMSARVRDVLLGEFVRLTLGPEGPVERLQRRQNVRLRAILPLTLTVEGEGEIRELFTQDISASGLRVIAPRAWKLGTGVKIHLTLDAQGRRLRCQGAVVRCRPTSEAEFDVGIGFTHMTPGDEDHLANFLLDLLRKRVNL